MKWSIRDLLNPVVTRSLLYGIDSFDMEYVLQRIDQIDTMSGKMIKQVWLGEWEKKAQKYIGLAEVSEQKGRFLSAREYYKMVANCYYASYMINTEDVEVKREVYDKLSCFYQKAIALRDNTVEEVQIDTEMGILYGYLHYPEQRQDKKEYPCVITYSGLGSCKEELDMLVHPLIARGMAVLALDMPGTGKSLFVSGLRCIGEHLEAAMDAAFQFVQKKEQIDSARIGNMGLCMGGGYAFRASVKHPASACTVSLFPLFLNLADQDAIPIWMKRGRWSNYQYGDGHVDGYLEKMKVLEEGTIVNDFLMVYSADDNWMNTEASMNLYNRALGYKEKMLIDEKPAYVSEETIMHAMPVGEQFHWVQHVAADFMAERLMGEERIA